MVASLARGNATDVDLPGCAARQEGARLVGIRSGCQDRRRDIVVGTQRNHPQRCLRADEAASYSLDGAVATGGNDQPVTSGGGRTRFVAGRDLRNLTRTSARIPNVASLSTRWRTCRMLSWFGPDLLLMMSSARLFGQSPTTGAMATSGLSVASGANASASPRRRASLRARDSSARSREAVCSAVRLLEVFAPTTHDGSYKARSVPAFFVPLADGMPRALSRTGKTKLMAHPRESR